MPLLSSKCKASHECCSRCRRHPGENHLGASLGWSVEVSGVAGTSLFFERFVTIKASHHSGGRSVLKHSDSELALRDISCIDGSRGPMGPGVFVHQKDRSNVFQQYRNISPIIVKSASLSESKISCRLMDHPMMSHRLSLVLFTCIVLPV